MSNSRYLQYAINDGSGVHTRCGRTIPRLDAGFYDAIDCGYGQWGVKKKDMVSDELIDIPGTIADEIFTDIDKFLATKVEYELYALTHKRGYLFYGPPGSGKTSLGLMLGKRFIQSADGVVLFAGSYNEFYNGVAFMRDMEPGRPTMYLIEEADTIINNPHCLSILDGELSIEGAVFVAMTNYKGHMPPRISNRPGRFDRVELVSCPPEPVQLEYLRRVEARGGKNPDAPQRIVEALRGISISLAHLREAFISHVLMGVGLPEIRYRFELMSGMRNEDGEMTDLFEGMKTPNELNQGEDSNLDDWELEEAKTWEPDEPMADD